MKINPSMLKQAMKQMGIKEVKIDATEVIIKTPSKNLILRNPSVSKINAMGQETLQILGTIEEESNNEEDINMIVEQTKTDKETVKKTLEKNNGDIAKTILELQ